MTDSVTEADYERPTPVGDATLAWLGPLLTRYRAVLGARPALREGFNTLRLARTADARLALLGTPRDPGRQLVVLGPTQAGKSTLVNALTGATATGERAGVSALAGFTVHAQAFALGGGEAFENGLDALDALLAPLERLPFDRIRDSPLAAWSCVRVDAGAGAVPGTLTGAPSGGARAGAPRTHASPGTVVWDTPDFDSIEAGTYRESVLATAGLADAIVLMLSKDKYADRSVWDTLALVRSLDVPLLVVINKLDAADKPVVRAAFVRHHEERFGSAGPELFVVPWLESRDGEPAAFDPGLLRERLAPALGAALDAAGDLPRRREALRRFVAAHREAWLAPLHAEIDARDAWSDAVREIEAVAIDEYASRYLEDPDRYETFDRTLAELLTLLEVPGFAKTLANTRRLVTWPARRLLGAGVGAFRQARPVVDRELEVLDTVLERATTRARDVVLERQREPSEREEPDWWRALEHELSAAREPLKARWHAEALRVRTEFEPRIEAAAARLHEQLRERPALLNSLRAARVTTDAAGVALALKSGGLAPTDLVLAPAMLGVTTLLTESALGRYLEGVKRDLKREQRALVRQRLVEGVLGETLRGAVDAGGDGERLVTARTAPELARVLRRDG